DRRGVARERLVLLPRPLRQRELHELHLLELMLADQAARILPRRAGLAAEARRVRTEPARERGRVEDLVAIEIRDRHLGGRDEVVVAVGELEEVLLEFREVSRAAQ